MNYVTVALQKLKTFLIYMRGFFRRHWIGTVLIVFATLVFFWPVITRLDSYSEGGDAMFNAWTIARDQYCIMRQDCPNYADGNIYFPHEDTMLYSETQLSTGLLSMPLRLITDNPIFSYNVMTILSFFLGGWLMYLLAKYLSKGNELIAVTAGLIYEFGPFRMPAISHLQNLCTFYFPLMVLLILKFFQTGKKRYLLGLLPTLVLLFYASWYQLVFGVAILAILLGGMLLFKMVNWRAVLKVSVVVAVAGILTLPLAMEYMRFSKEKGASFPIAEQAYFSAAVKDFAIPYSGTLLGKVYYEINEDGKVNSYNPDSYSYYGFSLYGVGLFLLVSSFLWWRKNKRKKDSAREFKTVVIFWVMIVVGAVASLGPLIKIGQDYVHGQLASQGLGIVIPGPYYLVDVLLPQLMFIRALGRWGVLVLFALCCLLALLPPHLEKLKWRPRKRHILYAVVLIVAFIELAPLHQRPLLSPTDNPYAYNIKTPKAWEYIKQHKEINNIVVLHADADYPKAPWAFIDPEQEMWAGYTNRNVFNGYSGYNPPSYKQDMADFTDFQPDDVRQMKQYKLKYVMVDKQVSKSRPQLVDDVARALPKVYEDERHTLFRIP